MEKAFNGYEVIAREKVKLQEEKVLVEIFYTNKGLFKSSEVIATMDMATDSRNYNKLSIIVNSNINKVTNRDSLINGILEAWKDLEFKNIGSNTYLYYASIKPILTMVSSSITTKRKKVDPS